MSGTPGAMLIGDVHFGFYLWAMGRGRPPTAEDLAAVLREAGCYRIKGMRARCLLLTRPLAGSPSPASVNIS
jgi:demethylspheroidene O-methyltransferase